MKKPITLTILAAAALTSVPACAGNMVELKIIGSIRPTACTPSLGADGVADYGTIAAGSLVRGSYTRLPRKEMSFTIVCDAAANMALKTIDNRSASVVSGVAGAGVPDALVYGLGSVANSNVGGYRLFIPHATVMADSMPVMQIFSANGGNWSSTGDGMLGKDRILSWAASGTNTPAAFRTVQGVIAVEPYLNKPENLPLSHSVPLDGSVTLEVVYL